MKFLFDLFPVILFFITLKIAEKTASAGLVLSKILITLGIVTSVQPNLVPIMLATVAVIIGSMIQIVWAKFKFKKVDKTLWMSAILVTVLGGLTLYFQNDAFIKWKPTLLYWVFTLALLMGQWIWQTNIIKTMMGKEIKLPENIWLKLNYAWAIFFAALGFLNLYIAFNFSIDAWANFKLFGTMALMFTFIVIQSLMINRYIVEEK